MTGIALQTSIVYGPILSRRLGRSLGINLMPSDCKVCSFNCIYCEYGRTDILTSQPKRSSLPSVAEVRREVEKALRKPRTIEMITFSGNGEPTLHPDFPEIISMVKELRDQLRPAAKLGVLSNASTVYQPEILNALKMVEAPMMKIDAGDDHTFKAINRPKPGIEFSEIIFGLKSLQNLILQTMFVDGDVTNARGQAYEAWVNLVAELQPQKVHIYSIERPTAESNVACVEPKKLQWIAEDLNQRFGIIAEAFWRD